MKTTSKTPTGGAVIRPGDRKPGRVIAQWTWNLRLELGHQLKPQPLRTTEFAPAVAEAPETRAKQPPVQGYSAPAVALPWKENRFSGEDFTLHADGTLLCPEGKTLRPTEHRREADGSLRVLYSARIRDCRDCQVRERCQWHGSATTRPRRISLLLHPLPTGPAPLLWRDWSRRVHRRACLELVRTQHVDIGCAPALPATSPTSAEVILSRAQRAHTRLSWETRLARNARRGTAGQLTLTLYGVPNDFARHLGLMAG